MELSEVLSGSAGLSGVQWVLNGRTARRRMRGEITSLLSSARLNSLRLTRAKYKPGKHLKAYYEAKFTGDQRKQYRIRPIAAIWRLSELETEAGLEEGWLDVQAEAVARELAVPFQKLYKYSPTWGLQLQVSPFDPVFPQLVRLSDPEYIREMLAGIDAEHREGKWIQPGNRYEVTPIRYRPGERHVIRYDPVGPADLDGHGSAIFAKVYNNPRAGSKAYQVSSRVCDWLDAREDGIQGARPLAYLIQEGAILYPQITGRQLSNYLMDLSRRPDDYLRLAGSILHSLHNAPGELANALELRSFHDEARVVKRASEHVQILVPGIGGKILEILDRAEKLYDRLPQEQPTYTHSDYKADHLWVTPAGLTLIDFDTSSIFDPAIDIGKFLADLHWWYALSGRPGVEGAQDFFIQGYRSSFSSGPDSAASEDRLARARLYEAVILTKITLRRVPIYDPLWTERTAKLINQAEAVVKNLELLLGQPSTLL